MGCLVLSSAISLYIFLWFRIKAPHFYKRLKNWDDDYLESAYILVFNTTLPKGESTAEKILNLAKMVFPELRPDIYASVIDKPTMSSFIKALWKKIKSRDRKLITSETDVSKFANYVIDPSTLDLVYQTDEGSFIIKEFKDKSVTLQDLKETTALIKQNFPKVFPLT